MVYLVDDDQDVRSSMIRLLKSAAYPCMAFASTAEFLSKIHDLAPGCLVLDLAMPDMDGLELQKTLGGVENPMPIIFLTANATVPTSVAAMKAGAVDFLIKPVAPEILLATIERALSQEREIRARWSELVRTKALLARLTPREMDVLRLVTRGLLNKQIAAELGTAEKTVKIHRAHVMEKMEVESVAELVRLMERAGEV
jgi:FixJ family two-component response regulator